MIEAPPRIGVNALFLEPGMGGLETYVVEAVPRMASLAPESRITVLVNPRGERVFQGLSLPPNLSVECHRHLGRSGFRAISELTLLGLLAGRRFDVLLNVALTAPLATSAVNVVLLADITWLIFPDLADGNRRTLKLWRTIVPTVARRANRVIALTQSGARDIESLLGVRGSQIDVVPLGSGMGRVETPVPREALITSFGMGDGPIVLNVAAKKSHKNLVRLVQAMRIVVGRVPSAQLVMPGAPTAYEEVLRQEAIDLGIERSVCFPGFVSVAELEGLYAEATCFAFPSANEGFGLPVLEAMGRGVPVVCADTSALPEVAGDAAILVPPDDTDALAEAIIRAMTDSATRADMIERGRRQAASFTWDRCAAETLTVLARAVDQSEAR